MDIKKTTKSEFEQEFKLFEKLIDFNQDPVLTILRVHLLTEYYLERAIQIFLPRGDRIIDDGNLTYYQKLVIVSSFNLLDDKLIQGLKSLNKLRNQCAHGIDKQITNTEIDIIGRSDGKKCSEFRRKSGDSTKMYLYMVLSNLFGGLTGGVLFMENIDIEKNSIKKKKRP